MAATRGFLGGSFFDTSNLGFVATALFFSAANFPTALLGVEADVLSAPDGAPLVVPKSVSAS